MQITVKFFAILKDRAGVSEILLDIPPESKISNAVETLNARFPQIQNELKRTAIALNRTYTKSDASLQDGDELALIPPVSGGCA